LRRALQDGFCVAAFIRAWPVRERRRHDRQIAGARDSPAIRGNRARVVNRLKAKPTRRDAGSHASCSPDRSRHWRR
jgi:hypothetical protein